MRSEVQVLLDPPTTSLVVEYSLTVKQHGCFAVQLDDVIFGSFTSLREIQNIRIDGHPREGGRLLCSKSILFQVKYTNRNSSNAVRTVFVANQRQALQCMHFDLVLLDFYKRGEDTEAV